LPKYTLIELHNKQFQIRKLLVQVSSHVQSLYMGLYLSLLKIFSFSRLNQGHSPFLTFATFITLVGIKTKAVLFLGKRKER